MVKKFVTDIFTFEDSNVVFLGVLLGKDSEYILNNIREASQYIETYDLDHKKNLLENAKIFDLGNLRLKSLADISRKTKELVAKKKLPLLVSGGHLCSLFSLQAFDENTRIVIFDAHLDAKYEYLDRKIDKLSSFPGRKTDHQINDATWLRRLIEQGLGRKIILLGVRSGDDDEIKFLEKNGVHFFTSTQIKRSSEIVKLKIKEIVKENPVYISLDMDSFDPSFCPAVDHPEPNGLSFLNFKDMMGMVSSNIVGVDVCCLNSYPDNISSFLAVKSIYEILGMKDFTKV